MPYHINCQAHTPKQKGCAMKNYDLYERLIESMGSEHLLDEVFSYLDDITMNHALTYIDQMYGYGHSEDEDED